MCGIIGISAPAWTSKHEALFKKLLLRSSIRGLHATGVAFWQGDGVNSTSDTGSPRKAHLEHPRCVERQTCVIAHNRYSTSSLTHNQPCFDEGVALVHNGVVTQESPDGWMDTYGLQTKTDLDSELLLQAHLDGGAHPMVRFPQASIASILLNADGSMEAYRNHTRPMYYSVFNDDTFVITSTLDIARRSGLKAKRCGNGVSYKISGGTCGASEISGFTPKPDIQP